MMKIFDRLKAVAAMGLILTTSVGIIDGFFNLNLISFFFRNWDWLGWVISIVFWFLSPYVVAWTDGRQAREESESD